MVQPWPPVPPICQLNQHTAAQEDDKVSYSTHVQPYHPYQQPKVPQKNLQSTEAVSPAVMLAPANCRPSPAKAAFPGTTLPPPGVTGELPLPAVYEAERGEQAWSPRRSGSTVTARRAAAIGDNPQLKDSAVRMIAAVMGSSVIHTGGFD